MTAHFTVARQQAANFQSIPYRKPASFMTISEGDCSGERTKGILKVFISMPSSITTPRWHAAAPSSWICSISARLFAGLLHP